MSRHDIIVEKAHVGRLIGSGGSTYKELGQKTQCNIFVLDKEGPAPGFPEDQRIVVLIGSQAQVAHADLEIAQLLQGAPPNAGAAVGQSQVGGSGLYGSSGLEPGQHAALQQFALMQALLQQQQAGVAAAASAVAAAGGQSQGFIGQKLVHNFPGLETPSGRRIQMLENTPGMSRHDIIVEKAHVGRLIGSGGSTYKELTQKTGCNIFVLDKEGPAPGFPEDQRIVVLIGTEAQVAHSDLEIAQLLQGAAPGNAGGTAVSYTGAQTADPQQEQHVSDSSGSAVGPMQHAGSATSGTKLAPGFPGLDTPSGRRISVLEQTPGHVRQDMMISKSYVGRLIGSGGSTYKELMVKTSCNIFILDKEGPPPGYGDDQRMITLIGFESQVAHAEVEINSLLQSAMTRPSTQMAQMSVATRPSMPKQANPFSPPMGSYNPAPFCDLTGGTLSSNSTSGGGAYGPPEQSRGVKRLHEQE